MKQARGVALVEVVVVVLLVGVLVAACLPAVREQRRQASIKADLNGLRLIGQASAMYSDASEDRLFAFSWKPGEVPATRNTQLSLACAALDPNDTNSSSELRAAVLQQLDIVTHGFKDERLPPMPGVVPPNHAPFVQFNHLVLARFMGSSLPAELFVSRADAQRAYWARTIDSYLDDPASSRVRPPTAETSFVQLWRWPFSSSYQVGVSHYSIDFAPPETAERSNHHRAWSMPYEPGVLGNRTMSEVLFPGQKVMMFDEYDRYGAGGARYFALQGASNIVNFYDGHAARVLTADSNFGFSPNNPDATSPRVYVYSPLPWWDPVGAVSTHVALYYDQTRDGLRGVDFSGK